MCKEPKPEQLVLSPLGSTQSKVKDFLLIKELCCFPGFDKVVGCLEKPMQYLVEACSNEVPIHMSDLNGNEKLMERSCFNLEQV